MTTPPALALPARAKLNLDLQVLGRRQDGFHDLRTTMQAIDLHDLLEITPSSETVLTVSGLEVPAASDNSVLKAHRALEQAVRRPLPTRFHLHKRVPPGSGMGGASSDAAAALRALAAVHKLEVDLRSVAQTVGSDVPFFLAGGTQQARGRGEVLAVLPTEPAWFAVAWPGIRLSTADVYRAWDEVGGETPNELRRAAEHVAPSLVEFAQTLDGAGWQMTGSGSAFFRRCASRDEAAEVTASQRCWAVAACSVDAWA